MLKQINSLPRYIFVTDRIRSPVDLGGHSACLLKLDEGAHFIAEYSYPTSARSADSLRFEISADEWKRIADRFADETEGLDLNDARKARSLISIFEEYGMTHH